MLLRAVSLRPRDELWWVPSLLSVGSSDAALLRVGPAFYGQAVALHASAFLLEEGPGVSSAAAGALLLRSVRPAEPLEVQGREVPWVRRWLPGA
jgi:hypothetical protein